MKFIKNMVKWLMMKGVMKIIEDDRKRWKRALQLRRKSVCFYFIWIGFTYKKTSKIISSFFWSGLFTSFCIIWRFSYFI
jgi:hypothetical protein